MGGRRERSIKLLVFLAIILPLLVVNDLACPTGCLLIGRRKENGPDGTRQVGFDVVIIVATHFSSPLVSLPSSPSSPLTSPPSLHPSPAPPPLQLSPLLHRLPTPQAAGVLFDSWQYARWGYFCHVSDIKLSTRWMEGGGGGGGGGRGVGHDRNNVLPMPHLPNNECWNDLRQCHTHLRHGCC